MAVNTKGSLQSVTKSHHNIFGYEAESELSEYQSLSTLQIVLRNRKMYAYTELKQTYDQKIYCGPI